MPARPSRAPPAGPAKLDRAGLERLYVEMERSLYNVVYRWVWQREAAQDVVQEAFVRLWRMRARVDMTTVRPLVYRIAINLASNRRRARKLWRLVSLEAVVGRSAGEAGAEEVMAREQAREAVRRAVEALPEKQRRVVTLCELGGLSYAEVAGVLGIPEGTVGSRRNAALRRLRGTLGAEALEEARDAM